MNGPWCKFLVIVLVVMNVLLVSKILRVSRGGPPPNRGPKAYTHRATIPDAVVVDRDGHVHTLRRLVAGIPRTLLVVFSPSDCPPCLEEISLWGQISQRFSVPVYGIGVCPSGQEFWNWEANVGVPIPIYLDTAFTFADSIALRVTPAKVLVSSAGSILWVDPTRLSTEDRHAFWEDMARALELED